jgi:hypothetical protein
MKRGELMAYNTWPFYVNPPIANPYIQSAGTDNYDIFSYQNPYGGYDNNTYYGQLMGLGGCFCKKSYFRIMNTYPDITMNVHVNEIVMAENLKKGEFTKYVQFPPGRYDVKIFTSENDENPAFESEIDIDRNLTYTGVIIPDGEDLDDISILMIPEAKEKSIKGRISAIRMVNAACNAPKLVLEDSEGTTWFSGVDCGNASNNIAVPSGRYSLALKEKAKKNNVIKTLDVDFAPKMHYTIFVTGNCEEEPGIKIVTPEDGVNYLDIC